MELRNTAQGKSDPAARVGDAERGHASALLEEHLRAGRIDLNEFDARFQQVTRAVTVADLDTVFADLTVPRKPGRNPWQWAVVALGLVCVVLIAAVVLVANRSPGADGPAVAATSPPTSARSSLPSTATTAPTTTATATATSAATSTSGTGPGTNTAAVQYLMDFDMLADRDYYDFEDGPGSISGTTYSRSVMLEPGRDELAYTEYDLGRKFTRLDGVLGIRDDATPSDLAMQIQIYADGVLLNETTVKLGVAVPIQLTFDKPLRLRLQVTDLTEGAQGHAVFGDLRVTK